MPIVCTARISGENLELDFEGSGPQARGAVNLPDSALKASIYYCVKAVLDPGLMPNQGIIDPIKITAPAGTIVNPKPPAAVAGARRDLQPPLRRGVRRALPGAATRGGHGVLQRFHIGHVGLRLALPAGRRPMSIPRAWAAAPEPSPTATGRMRSTSTP